MTIVHGFELLREENIAEINSRALLFRHVKTGAELLSLVNDDENKVFGITFRTPPGDSSGIAHIMEHSVLCGSKKYPVKEPFVELVKGSLNTFLNAFTYPDKTCYPVASQNLKDFYNLIDVYLDAVFHPAITPYTLSQEGWHYELDDPKNPLGYRGVVFNEMKGNYSSPDRLISEYSQQSIFPGHVYGVDSGGDPHHIPELTFERFKAFHDLYYHPSNARIYFYGDDQPEERLRIVNEYLKNFDRKDVDSNIPLIARWPQPRRDTRRYGVSGDAPVEKKGFLTVNWLLSEITDSQTVLTLRMLAHILMGTPASPLWKALIDSGLGEDITGVGLETDLRQSYFSAGLKGIAVSDSDKVERLILDTLERLAREGIDPATVEASLNTIEFRLREQNTGSYPRGLVVMLSTLHTWLYGGDPLDPLRYERHLKTLREKLAADKRYFETLIREHLLNNHHRTTVILEPDTHFTEQEESDEKSRLAKAKVGMGPEQLQAIIADTKELKRRQETPDDPAALARIPRLKLADLDRSNKHIPLALEQLAGAKILYHDLFTNGIVYLTAGFDLRAVPQELLPYMPLFSRSLVEIGTEKEDFVKLSQRIGQKTGGVRPMTLVSSKQDAEGSIAWLFLSGKVMASQTSDLLEILHDVLLTVRFDNQERFRQMVLEEKAGQEASLIPSGHGIVSTRLRSHFNEAGWLAERIGGVSYLFFLRDLAQRVDSDWPSVLASLEKIRESLINRDEMICNVTVDAKTWKQFQPQLAEFLGRLPLLPREVSKWSPAYHPELEALTIPAQVNYVGKGASLYKLGYHFHGSALVISNYLRTTWLWERVRMQGGAYGAYASFDRRSGVFNFLSYRDPNLLKTLENYDAASSFLRNLSLNEDELTKGIIGTIGDLDAYQLPDAKGYTSMVRYLAGDSEEARQQMRDEVLSTTEKNFRHFAEVLQQVKEKGLVVVMGSQAAVDAVNRERNNWLKVIKVM